MIRKLTQNPKIDPKPENETAGKLNTAAGCGPLDGNVRRTNAEKRTHRGADPIRSAAGRSGQEGERYLPGGGSFSAGLLQLEAPLRRSGSERVARVAPTAGRESQAENSGCG